MRFLSIGECMAELAPGFGPGDFRLGFAGDTFNTAWYVASIRPDAHVSYFTAVGGDRISDQMRAAIMGAGIDGSHIQTVPDRTVGLYLISLDKGERSFSYWRGQSAARLLARDGAALAVAMQAAEMIYFSGITLAILEPDGRDVLLDALRTARAAGKVIVFDPNLRPRLWPDTKKMIDAIMLGAGVSDIVLPSFEDEADWFGDASPEATAARYAEVGAQTVIVKNGAEPVFYRQGAAFGVLPVPSLQSVLDTTAAGDSFNAAFLAALHAGQPLAEAVALACKLAGQVVQGKGALVPVDPRDFALPPVRG